MQSDVDKIKERLNIADIVGQYVKLTKSGGSLKGLSPFTSERTPSFFVSPDRGLFHCFSSGKGGDVFTFIQEIEGLDFQGALVLLAEKAGVELTGTTSDISRKEVDLMRDALEKAQTLYQEQINTAASSYLQERGVTEKTIQDFKLGYAPDSFSFLYDKLSKEYADSILIAMGLVREGKKTPYDYFRDRIIFPITDTQGRIAGFSGRALSKDHKGPKYLNSPDSKLFDKSSLLFGFSEGKQTMRKLDCAIMVEGQFDLVLSHQAGYANTVATSGTGTTVNHLKVIERITQNLILAFDSDRAGISSMLRTAKLAFSNGFRVKIALIPEGKDPADIISDNPESWKEIIKQAKPAIEAFVLIFERSARDREHLLHMIRSYVLPVVATMKSPIEKDNALRYIADQVSLSMDAVTEELKGISTVSPESTKLASPPKKFERPDHALDLISLISWQEELKQPLVTSDRLTTVKEEMVRLSLSTSYPDEMVNERVFWLEERIGTNSKKLEEYLHDTLTALEVEVIERRKQELSKKLNSSISDSEESKVLKELDELGKRRNQLLDKSNKTL